MTTTGRKLVVAFFLIAALSSCSYAHRNPIEKQRLDAWRIVNHDYENYYLILKNQLKGGVFTNEQWNSEVYPVVKRAYDALQKANAAGSANDAETYQEQLAKASSEINQMKILAKVTP